jgi:tetratricopeptide (TPR) repeat protein
MIRHIAALVLALTAPAVARAEWYEASSDHFVVYADDRPEAITRFTEELEKFDKALRVFYPKARPAATGPANRVAVFVLSGSTSVSKLIGDKFTRGFYIPRAGANVAFVPRVSGKTDTYDLSGAAVLRHEYAHHFMYTSFPAVFPIWFSEGFAEFWSTVRFERDGSATVGIAPYHRAWGLVSGNPLPVDQLLTLTNRKLSEAQREAIYGRGWLLTHYLMSDRERQRQLAEYMLAINRGESLDKAATVFGDLKQLGRELENYLNRSRLPASTIAATALATSTVKLRKLTPGEVATMPVRVQSRAGVDEKEAKTVVIEARKAADPYPNDAGAQVALAEAEYDAGNYALAHAAADRALAADPKLGEALLYRAMAKFALAEADDPKAEPWQAIRRAIVAANRADPEDPRPLMLNYRSYFAAGEAPSANAKAGLAKAYDTALSDLGLRMNAATMFLQDGNPVEAREALRLIAFHPHGAGGMSARARAMISAIDRGDSADKTLAAEAEEDEPAEKPDRPKN